MTTDADRLQADFLDDLSKQLHDRALTLRQQADVADAAAARSNLETYRVRAFINGTIEFLVHAPDRGAANTIARRWTEQTESAIEMSQDMGELLDETDLPEHWDLTEERVVSVAHSFTNFDRLS